MKLKKESINWSAENIENLQKFIRVRKADKLHSFGVVITKKTYSEDYIVEVPERVYKKFYEAFAYWEREGKYEILTKIGD